MGAIQGHADDDDVDATQMTIQAHKHNLITSSFLFVSVIFDANFMINPGTEIKIVFNIDTN